jgi:hypothetical protein
MIEELRRLRSSCEPKSNQNPRYLRYSNAVSALLWIVDDLRSEASATETALAESEDRLKRLADRFEDWVHDGIPSLAPYRPTDFLEMVRLHGAVGATKRLLAMPGHTSYGFQRLYELGRLDASVEFGACLPWFEELFTGDEIKEARTRLIVHKFPLKEKLAAAVAARPDWTWRE